VRPTHTDEYVFVAAHEELEELLPGDGLIAERTSAGKLRSGSRPSRTSARSLRSSRRRVPSRADVVLELVRNESWLAFCGYLGDLRSRIAVNVDLPLSEPAWADHMLRFFRAETSRIYVMTYPAGRDLCRSYVAGRPERFRRLLTEQVRVLDLLDF
jgi:hypothetical protein